MSAQVHALVERTYRQESRRVLATLIRRLGDFDLAEEALHDAFMAAVDQWPREGIPDNPRAWLVTAGRFKAIDRLRRRARFDASLDTLAQHLEQEPPASGDPAEVESVEDDRLRLVFTCCHPALPESARVALTLREVCGLTTEQIARAFLTRPATVAQRIVRAKAKIREAAIPYQVPEAGELPERLESVLSVIYLVFNEGYAASDGDCMLRADLSTEAIRLGRLLHGLIPDPEVLGLLALMLLHEARRSSRLDEAGGLIVLSEQDRRLWDREMIAEGQSLIERAFAAGEVGHYTLQAAIADVHARAVDAEHTDWGRIVALYDVLAQAMPSPVVALNRAVAVAMRDGPEEGLALIDSILMRGELTDYHLAHAARADLYRRLGQLSAAREAYRRALALTGQVSERDFLSRRLAALGEEGGRGS